MSVFSVGPSTPWGMQCGRLARLVERSQVPLLSDGRRQPHPAGQAIGAELFGGRSLRRGDWELLDMGSGKWRLFNMAIDPGETRDLAAASPSVRPS